MGAKTFISIAIFNSTGAKAPAESSYTPTNDGGASHAAWSLFRMIADAVVYGAQKALGWLTK